MNTVAPEEQVERARRFRALHAGDGAFLLPNCWDAASARILEHCGFEAIATASAGVSWAHGVADGEHLTRAQLLAAVGRIAGAVAVPVSADIEKGYGETPDGVAETVRGVIAAGAIGINIEDSLPEGGQRPVAEMQDRIRAARAAADAAGLPLVINARVDAYLLGRSGEAVLDDTIARGNAWREAGADCVFVPGTGDRDTIARLADGIGGPVNIIVGGPDTPSLAELGDLGVRRVSLGPRLMQATMAGLQACASRIRRDGDFRALEGMTDFAAMNRLFD